MQKYDHNELPIRAKRQMAEDVVEVLHCLHQGRRSAVDLLIEGIKVRAVHLDPQIQQDVLMFAEQVQFQYDYDPCHNITVDVQKAADRLLEDLGIVQ